MKLLRVLFGLFCAGSLARAVEQLIPIPAQSWSIVIDAPQLGAHQDHSVGGEYQFEGRAGGLVISLFVEAPKTNDVASNIACREYYWSRGSRNPAIKPGSVKIESFPRFERVQYAHVLPQAPAGWERMNANYFFVHAGRWVDVHISWDPTDAAMAGLVRTFEAALTTRDFASPVARAGEAERVIALPRRPALAFTLPDRWQSVTVWPERDLPPTLKTGPAKRDHPSLKITPIFSDAKKTPAATEATAERFAREAMLAVQPSATQPLELQHWQQGDVASWYFCATDKAPKRGEYPYLIQGVARIDELLVSYTALMRQNRPADIEQILAVLRSMHRRSL